MLELSERKLTKKFPIMHCIIWRIYGILYKSHKISDISDVLCDLYSRLSKEWCDEQAQAQLKNGILFKGRNQQQEIEKDGRLPFRPFFKPELISALPR